MLLCISVIIIISVYINIPDIFKILKMLRVYLDIVLGDPLFGLFLKLRLKTHFFKKK